MRALPKEQVRRQIALERLRRIRATVLTRSQSISPEEGDALSNRFSHEMIEDLVREGKIEIEFENQTDTE